MYAWDFANVGAPNNDLAPCTRETGLAFAFDGPGRSR